MTRRWMVMMTAASLLLGSCSNTATTDGDADDAAEVEGVEDAEGPAPTTAPAGSPMGGEGWLLFQAVFDGDVVDLGLVRPDGSELQRLPGSPATAGIPTGPPTGP
jgi:hypothetical protein